MSDVDMMPVVQSHSLTQLSSSQQRPPRGYYVVHAQHPTIVTHSVIAHFTGPTETNLILARVDRLDIFRLTDSGIEPIKEIPINGRIATLSTLTPSTTASTGHGDRLMVLTETNTLIVLEYDSERAVIKSLVSADLSHRVSHHSDSGQMTIIDPSQSLVLVSAYDSLLSLLPIDAKTGTIANTNYTDVHCDITNILAIQFLSGYAKPTVAFLYRDAKEFCHIKTFYCDVRAGKLEAGPIQIGSLVHRPRHLVPVYDNIGGFLVIGEESIDYYQSKTVAASVRLLRPVTVTCWTKIDRTRYLIGDLHGDLHLLSLSLSQSHAVTALSLQRLGTTSIAHCLSYIDNGYVFVGSTVGDHALVKLNQNADAETGEYLTVIDTYPNLGAIVDMMVQTNSSDSGGSQTQLVTCSNAFQHGSLRVIRAGVGITEEASIELPGIQSLFALKPSIADQYHKFLLQSFISETRVLMIENEELSEIELSGVDSSVSTLWANTVIGAHYLLQITHDSARVVDSQSYQLVTQWKPSGGKITQGSSNDRLVLVACGSLLTLLEWQPQSLSLAVLASVTLDYEISCIDLTKINVSDSDSSSVAVLGMWNDYTVRVLSLPSLTELSRASTNSEVIPRSVLIAPFDDDSVYVLCGLGDGHLVYWNFHPLTGALTNTKKLLLSSQPIILSHFSLNNQSMVFLSCDRPTIIHHSHGRLLLLNVNLRSINSMTAFHTDMFGQSLALATTSGLLIGQCDTIQKLHIQSIPLHAQPRHILHCRDESTIVVSVDSMVVDESVRASAGVVWREQSSVVSLNDSDYSEASRYQLPNNETVCAIQSLMYNNRRYVVVGATVVKATEDHPRAGTLTLLAIEDKKLIFLTKVDVKGAVYAIENLSKYNKLVTSVNNRVIIWAPVMSAGGALSLKHECSHITGTLALTLHAFDDYVAVGDLQQSVTYLMYQPATPHSVAALERVARDRNGLWVTATDVIGANSEQPIILVADHDYNLVTMTRLTDASADERSKLTITGKYHCGDFVNAIIAGSLVHHYSVADTSTAATTDADNDGDSRIQATHLLGTISGAILLLAPLNKAQYKFFRQLEECLEKLIGAVGGLSRRQYRGFQSERVSEAHSQNFIDGDLIELCSELMIDKQRSLAAMMGCDWDTISKKVDEVTRLH